MRAQKEGFCKERSVNDSYKARRASPNDMSLGKL